MALRSLDNALPIAAERPRKAAKIAISDQKGKQQPDHVVNDENQVPVPVPLSTDVSIDYISSENLKPFEDPNPKIQVISCKIRIFVSMNPWL